MKSALVLVTEGSEELEAVTIIDVLRRGGVKVTVVSVLETDKIIKCANGTHLLADEHLGDLNDKLGFDAIILPGGSKAAETYSADSNVQSLLKAYEAAEKLVAVICASTTAIRAAACFKGRKATSYPSLRADVEDFYDYQEMTVVADGNLITSRGPATAMAFALRLVEYLVGKTQSDKVASGLLFE